MVPASAGAPAPGRPSGQAFRQLRVGLTGGIGCGKSTLLAYFRSLGCACCDDDAIVHSLYAPGGAAVEPLRQHFPTAINADGSILRPELSRIIQAAASPAEVLRTIEGVVHPLVGQAKMAFMESEAAGAWLVILDIPLLMEGLRAQGVAHGPGYLDAIVLVTCSDEAQRRRCMLRPGMTPEKFELILQKQMPRAERLAYATYVVDTGLAGLDETASLVAGRAQAAAVVGKLAAQHGGPLSVLGTGGAPSQMPRMLGGQPRLTCVTFDLDETLFRISPSIARAIDASKAVLDARAPRLMAHVAAGGQALRELMLSAMEAVRAEHPFLAHDFTEVRRLAILKLATEAGDVEPAALAADATAAFLRGRGSVDGDTFEDALPVLRALRRHGLRVGSISNGNADLASFAPQLHEALDFAVSASMAGAAKPDPAPFLAAAHLAGVADLRCIAHIGDSLKNDVVGAKALGIRSVLLRRPGSGEEQEHEAGGNGTAAAQPHALISSLWELEHLAVEWGAGPPASSI